MTQILREIHTKFLFVRLLPQLVCDLILVHVGRGDVIHASRRSSDSPQSPRSKAFVEEILAR